MTEPADLQQEVWQQIRDRHEKTTVRVYCEDPSHGGQRVRAIRTKVTGVADEGGWNPDVPSRTRYFCQECGDNLRAHGRTEERLTEVFETLLRHDVHDVSLSALRRTVLD